MVDELFMMPYSSKSKQSVDSCLSFYAFLDSDSGKGVTVHRSHCTG